MATSASTSAPNVEVLVALTLPSVESAYDAIYEFTPGKIETSNK